MKLIFYDKFWHLEKEMFHNDSWSDLISLMMIILSHAYEKDLWKWKSRKHNPLDVANY